MMTHLKGVQKNQTKDSRDSNVEPELHVGLPMCYTYSYEAQIPSKVDRVKAQWNIVKPPGLQYPHFKGASETNLLAPETTGMEMAQYRELCDIHFKHLKSQQDVEEPTETKSILQKPASPKVLAKAEPIPNVKRIGEVAQSEDARSNLESLIKTLKEYPQERIEAEIFTLN